MITGFNTDVQYNGRVYHVQTEDRGQEHPVLESLVYVGGTIIARKQTLYEDQLRQGATEDMIAGLLRRQHQVIIAAIKAGRVEDLIRISAREQGEETRPTAPVMPVVAPEPEQTERPARVTGSLQPPKLSDVPKFEPPSRTEEPPPAPGPRDTGRIGLNLDQVISDYLKRSSEQGRLDIKVITPNVFLAGKSISLKVEVWRGNSIEADSIVTVKIIGTAFKPLVYMARADRNGVASFSLTLPAFTAGTAAIVIEAQSNRGRGELKHLIRRA